MDATGLTSITCHEQHFPHLDTDFLTAERLHKFTEETAVKDFRAKAGTSDMVPTLVIAVYAKQNMLRFFPCDWRDEKEKVRILECLNMIFNDETMRPDRYAFQGEVWIASIKADERGRFDGRPASQQPNRLDGLTIITVEDKPNQAPLFTSWVRRPSEDGFLIEKSSDSRTDSDLTGFEGRLCDLFKPLTDGDGVTHKVYMMRT